MSNFIIFALTILCDTVLPGEVAHMQKYHTFKFRFLLSARLLNSPPSDRASLQNSSIVPAAVRSHLKAEYFPPRCGQQTATPRSDILYGPQGSTSAVIFSDSILFYLVFKRLALFEWLCMAPTSWCLCWVASFTRTLCKTVFLNVPHLHTPSVKVM